MSVPQIHYPKTVQSVLKNNDVSLDEFDRMITATFGLGDADCARILYETCVELGLFEKKSLGFTPEDLAFIIHQQEDMMLRTHGAIATDPEVHPIDRYDALVQVEKVLRQYDEDRDFEGLIRLNYQLAAALNGDVARATRWFVEGNAPELLPLFVEILACPQAGTSLLADVQERLELILEDDDAMLSSYFPPALLAQAGGRRGQELAIFCLEALVGRPFVEAIFGLAASETPSELEVVEGCPADYEFELVACFGDPSDQRLLQPTILD